MGDLERLGAALRDDNSQASARLRQMTITSISGGLVTGTMAGDTITVPALEPVYIVGDQVWVAMQGPNPWLVVGRETATTPKLTKYATFTADATSGQTQTTTVVSFGMTFPTTPVVICQILENPANPVFWEVIARSTTQFTIEIGKITLTAFGANAGYTFGYVASG